MRRVTRNFLIGLGVVVVLLLALGALPGYLKSGDPYYMTATAVEGATVDENGTVQGGDLALSGTVNASTLSERVYPFTTGALADAGNGTGYSEPYWDGPFGIKGSFTHSPFDELGSLRTQFPEATDTESALVAHNGTVYRLEITQR